MISRNIEVSPEDESLLREKMRGMGTGMNSVLGSAASAAMVNRTHRVVQERAKNLQARRSKVRSLWIPLAVSGGMVAAIVTAIWTILEQDELIPSDMPDANQQLLVLMMWCLPVTVLLMAVVLYRRANAATDNGRAG